MKLLMSAGKRCNPFPHLHLSPPATRGSTGEGEGEGEGDREADAARGSPF